MKTSTRPAAHRLFLRGWLAASVLTMLLAVKVSAQWGDGCLDGNFDYYDLPPFEYLTATNSGLPPALADQINFSLPSGQNAWEIVTEGTDPKAWQLQMVYSGYYALRLGDDQIGAQADMVRKTKAITPSTSKLRFAFAMVCELPDHNSNEQPWFVVRIRDSNGNIDDFKTYWKHSSPHGVDNFQRVDNNSTTVYRDWETRTILLDEYIGQTITVEFLNADCQFGGHWGYTYLDDVCFTGCCPTCIPDENNYIQNGKFEWGDKHFDSDLTFNSGANPQAGQYAIVNSSALSAPYQVVPEPGGPGEGDFMLANVSATTSTIWEHSLTVADDVRYRFCAFLNHAELPPGSLDPGTFHFEVNGEQVTSSISIGQEPDEWVRLHGCWESSGTTATIKLIATGSPNGAVVALDNISFGICESCEGRVDIGADRVICAGDDVQLLATITPLPNSYNDLTYQWFDPDGEPFATTYHTTVSAAGTYRIVVTWPDGCTHADEVEVIIPEIEIDLEPDLYFCSFDPPVYMDVSATTSYGSGDLSYQWSPASGLVPNNEQNPKITEAKTYTLTVSDEFGCFATAVVTVHLQELIADAGPAATICNGEPAQLMASSFPTGVSYAWEPAGSLVNPQTRNPLALAPNTYTVTITDQNGCSSTDQVEVTEQLIDVAVRPDIEICFGQEVQLQIDHNLANYAPNYRHRWTPEHDLSDPEAAEPLATPHESRTYTLQVTSPEGCSAEDQIDLTVKPEAPQFQAHYGHIGDDNGTKIYFKDNICGTNKVADCGFLMAGLSEYSTNHDWAMLLLKTDNRGEYEWSRLYRRQQGPSTQFDLFHFVHDDFQPMAAPWQAVTERNGYVLAGESTGQNTKRDFIAMRTDLNGLNPEVRMIGGLENDGGYHIIQTADGGYIGTGFTVSWGHGNTDALVVRLAPDFTVDWVRTIGAAGWELGRQVIEADNGDFLLVGTTESFSGGREVLVVRLNPDGTTQWANTYGGPELDEGYAITELQQQSGFVVHANTENYLTGRSDTNSLVFHINNNGDATWSRLIETTADERAFTVLELPDGRIGLSITTEAINGNDPTFVILSPDGNDLLLQRAFGGPEAELADNLSLLENNSLAAGSTTSSFTPEPDTDLLLATTRPNPFNDCLTDPGFNLVPATVQGTSVTNNIFNAEVPDPVEQDNAVAEVQHTMERSYLCIEPVCHCEDNFVELTVAHDTDAPSGMCCFDLTLTNQPGNCTLYDVMVRAEGVVSGLPGPLFPGVARTVNLCIPEFSGDPKELTITAMDDEGNPVCESTRELHCQCDCSNLDAAGEALTIEWIPVDGPNTKCCYDLYIHNELDCFVPTPALEMEVPNQLLDRLTATNGAWTQSVPVPSGPETSVITFSGSAPMEPGASILVANVCTWYSAWGNMVFTMTGATGSACQPGPSLEAGCHDHCCEDIDITLGTTAISLANQEPGTCCFDLTVDLDLHYDCSAIGSMVMRNADGTAIWEQGGLSLAAQETAYLVACIGTAWTLPPGTSVTLELYDINGMLICSRTETLDLEGCPPYEVIDCCEFLDAQLTAPDVHHIGSPICYDLDVWETEEQCEIWNIRVTDPETGAVLHEHFPGTELDLSAPIDLGRFCPDPCVDGVATLQVQLEFYDADGNLLCTLLREASHTCSGGGSPGDGTLKTRGHNDEGDVLPVTFRVLPNPAHDRFSIAYDLPVSGTVRLALYDVRGRLVRELVNGVRETGPHQVLVEASELASGLYVVRLETGNRVMVVKLAVD